ncbi:MAG TPA: helix-turn-helix domain-containing protein [Clostridiales bacterium]|nr:helix-turn-helix domain-containing protein [Clostridiales bacterium]
MSDVKEIFGQNVLSLRKQANMTQAELGEKLNYSDKTISKWERGEAVPDITVLRQIADVFGVTVDDLVLDPKEKKKSYKAESALQKQAKKQAKKVVDSAEELARIGKVHKMVWSIVILSYWTAIALAMIVINQVLEIFFWQLLVYALPIHFLLHIVFSALWSKHKRVTEFFSIFFFCVSILAVVYVALLPYNFWKIFLLAIPLLVLTALGVSLPQYRKKNACGQVPPAE